MLKRTVDIFFSVLGLTFLSPILIIVALIVFLQDFHNPFYIAPRVGKNRKVFKMVKLRSMIVSADKSGVDSTSSDDSRITWIGKFIRKLKLDELTQLWNVVLGDMSLVVSSSSVDANGTEDNSAGGALTMTAGNGTLSLGIETTNGDTAANEGEAYSVSYSTTLGGASVAVGYTGFDANSNTSQKTDVTVSQSLGGGASIFAEYSNLSGAGAAAPTQTTGEGVVAVGTSVSF